MNLVLLKQAVTQVRVIRAGIVRLFRRRVCRRWWCSDHRRRSCHRGGHWPSGSTCKDNHVSGTPLLTFRKEQCSCRRLGTTSHKWNRQFVSHRQPRTFFDSASLLNVVHSAKLGQVRVNLPTIRTTDRPHPQSRHRSVNARAHTHTHCTAPGNIAVNNALHFALCHQTIPHRLGTGAPSPRQPQTATAPCHTNTVNENTELAGKIGQTSVQRRLVRPNTVSVTYNRHGTAHTHLRSKAR